MGADRKNCIMSVELAIRREMAYRQKIESLRMEPGGSTSNSTISRTDPLRSRVTSSTSSQAPRTTPGTPNVCPCPVHKLIQNQRPQTHVGLRPCQALPPRPNAWHHGPTPSPIRPPFTSPQYRPISNSSGPTTHHQTNHQHEPPQVEYTFCDLCKMEFENTFKLRMHYLSPKHRAKSKWERGKKVAAGVTKPNERPYCELCEIVCSDEDSFRFHLIGRKHNMRLYGCEKNMMGPDGGS